MIARHKRINHKAKEVSFMLSFGGPDVARLIKANLQCFYDGHDQIDYDWRGRANGYDWRESDFIEMFAAANMPISILPEKLRLAVAQWAFAQAVALGYVAEQVSNPNTFYFTAKGLDLMEKKQNDT